jgi:hypothetical protein
MRVVLALAVIAAMGFAGVKIAQSGDIRETTQRVDEQLQGRVDAVRGLLGTATSEQMSESAGSDVAVESPDPASDVSAAEATTVSYITGTGGVGVALRTACRADDRLSGGLAEGARVEIVEEGGGGCEGWSLVSTGDTQSWVSDEYLSAAAERTFASSRADGSDR